MPITLSNFAICYVFIHVSSCAYSFINTLSSIDWQQTDNEIMFVVTNLETRLFWGGGGFPVKPGQVATITCLPLVRDASDGRGWGSIVRKAQKRTRTDPCVTLSLSGSPVSRTVDKARPVCRCSAACERADCTAASSRDCTAFTTQCRPSRP